MGTDSGISVEKSALSERSEPSNGCEYIAVINFAKSYQAAPGPGVALAV